ncbi:MAG: hypothetical protein V4541_12725 [Bacteroidota bacterium]
MKLHHLNLVKAITLFSFSLFFIAIAPNANAQTLYKATAVAQVNIASDSHCIAITDNDVKGNGKFVVKNGMLDDISSLKFVLSNHELNRLLATNDNISFEQTHVMVLPMMGMVHFIGMLNVDGVNSRADFQLQYEINKDKSVTFKGTKSFKLSDYTKLAAVPQKDVLLDLNFVVKNDEELDSK